LVVPNNDYTVYSDGSLYYAKDLVTGDTQSNSLFSSLLATLNTNLGTAGGRLSIRPGTYDVNLASTAITNPIDFIGSGRGRTILRRTDTTHALPMLQFTTSGITVSDLTFDGNYPANTSAGGASEVQFNGSNNVVQNVEVKNWNGAGAINNHNVLTIRNCILTGANTSGKSAYGILSFSDSISTLVENCNIQYCDLNAIFGYGRMIISDTYMANNGRPSGGQIGIIAGGMPNAFCGVYNCTFDPGLGGDSGVELANADFEIIGNRINGQTAAGLVSDPGVVVGNCLIADNIIKNCKGPAIVMQYATQQYFSIRNNICFDNQATPTQTYGILVGHIGTPYTTIAADYYIIENNVLYGNTVAQWADLGTGQHKIVRNNDITMMP